MVLDARKGRHVSPIGRRCPAPLSSESSKREIFQKAVPPLKNFRQQSFNIHLGIIEVAPPCCAAPFFPCHAITGTKRQTKEELHRYTVSSVSQPGLADRKRDSTKSAASRAVIMEKDLEDYSAVLGLLWTVGRSCCETTPCFQTFSTVYSARSGVGPVLRQGRLCLPCFANGC